MKSKLLLTILVFLFVIININAQGITPAQQDSRPYKVYTALLTQTDTLAPVATVLENTIGDIVWYRSTTAVYGALLVSDVTKTIILIQGSSDGTNTLFATSVSGAAIQFSNDVVTDEINAIIEIRVYK
jgi:hypothetical protein